MKTIIIIAASGMIALSTVAKAAEPEMEGRHGLGTAWYQQNGMPQTHERLGRAARRAVGRVVDAAVQIVGHPAGCPRTAFCGCGTSVRAYGHPVRDLYLAANWSRFPRAAPATGMVAYRRGHVFYIEQAFNDGTVLAYDPNSGHHLTRIHRVSLAGYTVVNPHGRV